MTIGRLEKQLSEDDGVNESTYVEDNELYKKYTFEGDYCLVPFTMTPLDDIEIVLNLGQVCSSALHSLQ